MISIKTHGEGNSGVVGHSQASGTTPSLHPKILTCQRKHNTINGYEFKNLSLHNKSDHLCIIYHQLLHI